MWAMAMKEFRQMRRDRRTLAMMILLPVLLLVVFGYAASFDVDRVRTVVVGPRAGQVAAALPERLEVVLVAPGEGRQDAVEALRDAEAAVALVTTDAGQPQVLVDGADLFSARSVVTELKGRPALPDPEAERILAMLEVREWAKLTEPGTLASAKRLAARGSWREALDAMLGALTDDPDARQAMLEVFTVLGEDDELVTEYRRKLAAALF